MADRSPNPDTGDEAGARPGREYPGMPRWVKVSAIVVIGLILLVVVVLLVATALGLHTPGGPGRHAPSGDAAGTLFSGVIEDRIPSGGGYTTPSGVIGPGMQQP
jgi:hypothetical protein